jgi:hypothetical protein
MEHVRRQRGYLCEGAVHTVILRVVSGGWASSKASDDLGVEGDANRDRRLQTTGGPFRQRREIREADHRSAGLLETRDDPALQDGEILRWLMHDQGSPAYNAVSPGAHHALGDGSSLRCNLAKAAEPETYIA